MMVSFDSLRSFPRVQYAQNSPARALLLGGGMIHWTATEVEGGSAAEVGMEVGLEGGLPLLFCGGWTGGSTDWAANTDTGLH